MQIRRHRVWRASCSANSGQQPNGARIKFWKAGLHRVGGSPSGRRTMPEIRPSDHKRRTLASSAEISGAERVGVKSGADKTQQQGASSGRDDARTGTSAEATAQGLLDNLRCLQAKLPQHATRNDWYMALAYTVRDRMLERYTATVNAISAENAAKVVAYLSAEFLTGPHLGNSLVNLGLWDAAQKAVDSLGQDLTALLE